MGLNILPENVLYEVASLAVILLSKPIESFEQWGAKTNRNRGLGSSAFYNCGLLDFMSLRFRELLDHLLACLLGCGCHRTFIPSGTLAFQLRPSLEPQRCGIGHSR